MALDWLLERFRRNAEHDAFVWHDETFSYEQLLRKTEDAIGFLARQPIEPGAPVMLFADSSPGAIALLLAVAEEGHIVVPVAANTVADRNELARIAQCVVRIDVDAADGRRT